MTAGSGPSTKIKNGSGTTSNLFIRIWKWDKDNYVLYMQKDLTGLEIA